MEIILNRHRKRKDTYDSLHKTVIFSKRLFDSKDIIHTYYAYIIEDRTFLIFRNVTTLKELVELCNILAEYDSVFIIQDKLAEFIICEEYLNVNDIICKRYHVDTFNLLKSEVIELTQRENIFQEIKGRLTKVVNGIEIDVLKDISWTNYENVHKFLL